MNAVPEVIVHPVAPSSNLGFATQVRGDEERGDGERGRGLGGGGLGECGGGEGLSGGGKGLGGGGEGEGGGHEGLGGGGDGGGRGEGDSGGGGGGGGGWLGDGGGGLGDGGGGLGGGGGASGLGNGGGGLGGGDTLAPVQVFLQGRFLSQAEGRANSRKHKVGSGQPEVGTPKALLKAHLGFQFASRSRYTRLPSPCIVRTPLPLNPKDCSIGVPPSPDWTSPSCVKQRIWPSALTRRSPFRMLSPAPSAPRRSWRTFGHFDISSAGSGGEGTPQTRSRSNPQPVPAAQPR